MRKMRAIAAAAALVAAGSAFAGLNRVGPANLPAPPGHGFPTWYQDFNGMTLDLCLPDLNDPESAQATACLVPFNPPAGGYVFPTNFPDEAFYFNAGAGLTLPGGARARLVLALEAAFGAGAPAVNDQMVFARVRIVAGVPFPGTYTVTHPYGTSEHVVEQATGARDIFDTIDIGLTPLNFREALGGAIGPFLEHVNGAVSTEDPTLPPVQARYIVNGATMLGDGTDLGPITGSPNGTNFFQICGPMDGPGLPDRCISTADFSLAGRLHNGPVASPLAIERATYNRDSAGNIRIDVSAEAAAGIGQGVPLVSLGGPDIAPLRMRGPDGIGRYYAQGVPLPPDRLDRITVTNSGDNPPTSESAALVDLITVTSATYNGARGVVEVVASSSDKLVPLPELSIDELPNAAVLRGADPTVVTLGAAVSVPPPRVTVRSSRGGATVLDLTMTADTGTYLPGVPLAVADALSVQAGTAAVSVNVLANDKSNSTTPMLPATLAIVGQPTIGTASVVSGQIRYVPPATPGTTKITYTVNNSVGKSNVGTLDVTVTANTSAVPTTVNDAFTLPARTSLTMNVLANDASNGTTWRTLDPVQIVSPPAVGLVSVNSATGAVTYTSPANAIASNQSFTYRACGVNNNCSAPATVALTVTPPETLAVTAAKCVRPAQWDLRGTDTVSGGTVNLFYTTAAGEVTIANNVPVTAGAWQFRGTNSAAPCNGTFSIRSNLGTTLLNRAVTVK